jgi:hypothetical protein
VWVFVSNSLSVAHFAVVAYFAVGHSIAESSAKQGHGYGMPKPSPQVTVHVIWPWRMEERLSHLRRPLAHQKHTVTEYVFESPARELFG